MNKLEHYYAYKTDTNDGLETFTLMPVNNEAVFVKGSYIPSANTLVLVSEKSREVFDLIERFTEDGVYDMSKRTNKPKMERLRLQNNFDYQLGAEDAEWFIDQFVVNYKYAISILDKYKIKPVITPIEQPLDALTTGIITAP